MDRILTVDQVIQEIDKLTFKELHVHHTWKPDKASYNGNNALELQAGMRKYHIENKGWNDIGQHLTGLPDGRFVTGRPFSVTPASISGNNTGALAVEMLGNFDTGNDVLEGAQKESLLRLAKYFDEKSRYVRFHRENSSKTCPGTSINKDVFMSEVRAINNAPVAAPPINTATISKTSDYDFKSLQGYIGVGQDNIPGPITLSKCPLTKKGAKGNIVKWIQARLNFLGFNCGAVDGDFGNKTLAAVKTFQAKNGLVADGIIGQNTWRKLLGL